MRKISLLKCLCVAGLMLTGASCGDEPEKKDTLVEENNNKGTSAEENNNSEGEKGTSVEEDNNSEDKKEEEKVSSEFVVVCKAVTKAWVRAEVCQGDGFDVDVTKTQEPVDLDEVDWAKYGADNYEDALDNHRQECDKDKPEELVGCAEPNLQKMKACYDSIDAIGNCHGVLELQVFGDCAEICPE